MRYPGRFIFPIASYELILPQVPTREDPTTDTPHDARSRRSIGPFFLFGSLFVMMTDG